MPRPRRATVSEIAYHVLNRCVMRLPIFEKPGDYEAFERVLAEGLKRPDALGVLAYCLVPNHWHLVLWPRMGSNLSTWMQWLTVTHTHRWHQHHHGVGQGPLYQGRFKSFPIQRDGHLLTAMRYVEANALRAGLEALGGANGRGAGTGGDAAPARQAKKTKERHGGGRICPDRHGAGSPMTGHRDGSVRSVTPM